uniref:RRM domain-containing protein n=1 Tax=Rhabditophanes sp. KR3021 TaxID=114890 RepID=A0AC35U2P1_9BILA
MSKTLSEVNGRMVTAQPRMIIDKKVKKGVFEQLWDYLKGNVIEVKNMPLDCTPEEIETFFQGYNVTITYEQDEEEDYFLGTCELIANTREEADKIIRVFDGAFMIDHIISMIRK